MVQMDFEEYAEPAQDEIKAEKVDTSSSASIAVAA
jgi:hypothetical protein